jgi:RNA polymerase sigma-70 factor (ECF subfamily)
VPDTVPRTPTRARTRKCRRLESLRIEDQPTPFVSAISFLCRAVADPPFKYAQTSSENYPAGLTYFANRSYNFDVSRARTQREQVHLTTSQNDEVSMLLREWSDGDEKALKKLTPIVYEELRRLARYYMRGEHTGHSLQATALVNEAYLRLVDYKRMRWQNRAHFFAVSAQLMRRILVDHARRHNLKRGADVEHVSIDETAMVCGDRPVELVVLDTALQALARMDARKAQVVELRFFGGLSVEETAEVLKISPITVMRDWGTARAWLYHEMRDGHDGSGALETGR